MKKVDSYTISREIKHINKHTIPGDTRGGIDGAVFITFPKKYQ